MRIAITGGSGLVGRFMVEHALSRSETPVVFSRHPSPTFSAAVAHHPYALGDTPDLSGYDALIHCAFDHVPGRYRGGEGHDPEGFEQKNTRGSQRLFEAAKSSGVQTCVFLSSRAVYGDYPAGTTLHEQMPPKPDTLYGESKWAAEQHLHALAGPGFHTVVLRATGVYGNTPADPRHKWADLFRRFENTQDIPARRGTEVHGADLAKAAFMAMHARQQPHATYNVSDLPLDHHDLLQIWAEIRKIAPPLPPKSTAEISEMNCNLLRSIGWSPTGQTGLKRWLSQMVKHHRHNAS